MTAAEKQWRDVGDSMAGEEREQAESRDLLSSWCMLKGSLKTFSFSCEGNFVLQSHPKGKASPVRSKFWTSPVCKAICFRLTSLCFKAWATSCYAYDYQIMMTESNHKWKNEKNPFVMAFPLWVIGPCKWGLLAIFPVHMQSLAFLVLASVAVKLKQEKSQLWEEVMKLTDNCSRYLAIYF